MTCVTQLFSCTASCPSEPETQRKVDSGTSRRPGHIARSCEQPGQAAARQFLKKRINRSGKALASGPELAERAKIEWGRLSKIMDEGSDTRPSIDELCRIANALDVLEPSEGTGAAFITAALGPYGYAAHRSGGVAADLLGSAAHANDYAAAVCRAVSVHGPAGPDITATEADEALGSLDRAVALMLAGRGYLVKKRGS